MGRGFKGTVGVATGGSREKHGILERKWAAWMGFTHKSTFSQVGGNAEHEKRCAVVCGPALHSGQLSSPLFKTASYDLSERQKPDRSCDSVDRHARGRSFSQMSTSGGLVPRTLLG